ncbi:GpE family phage tail protein [Sansalvadorimonas verongulae]|nr:GpE family phage tail protein [Sansalvadorimonas verongulae]
MIAGVFHTPPSELWVMDHEELEFWIDQAQKWIKAKEP